jgi:hypothetical protein
LEWDSEVVQQFAILKLPANVLINSADRIVARDIPQDSLPIKLQELLK